MDKQGRDGEHHNEETKLAKKIKNFIYHPSDLIGSGFSSQVYKGVNQQESDPNKKSIAIKVIQLSKIQNEVQNYLLNNEVNALKLLKHPNVLQTIDILMTKNNVYIVTQFCEGGDLLKYIKNNGPFPQQKALSLIKDIVQGYKCIEQNNIIHRDLKTSNIFISKGKAKIADFGFCEFIGEKKPQIAYNVGSPAYMSPESYKQNQYSSKSDIWALGIIFYQLLIGQTPDRNLTYTEMANNLMSGKIKLINNQQIRRILSLCFKKNVKERIDATTLCELITAQYKSQNLNNTESNHNIHSSMTGPQNPLLAQGKSPNIMLPRALSPAKNQKDLKYFKSDNPKSFSHQGIALQNSNNANRVSHPQTPQHANNRRSVPRQRIAEQHKQNKIKPFTELLLFLYRILKFISQLKVEKINQILLVLFRHRIMIQNYVEQQNSLLNDQQQFYKQFHYLKSRFDEVYLQLSKDLNCKYTVPKQKIDSLANFPFIHPQALNIYRKMIKDVCTECMSILDSKAATQINKGQLCVIVDYLIIQHQLLGLHLEGLNISEVIQISKLQAIIRQQPKKWTHNHFQLLKIKFHFLFNQNIPQLNRSNQIIQRQRIITNKTNNPISIQNQEFKVINNFGMLNQQQSIPHGSIVAVPHSLNHINSGSPIYAGFHSNNNLTQLGVQQSLMMPK